MGMEIKVQEHKEVKIRQQENGKKGRGRRWDKGTPFGGGPTQDEWWMLPLEPWFKIR